MDCKKKGCGHPLAVHDPCSLCRCRAFTPTAQKRRAAMLTDLQPVARMDEERLAEIREQELRRLAALS